MRGGSVYDLPVSPAALSLLYDLPVITAALFFSVGFTFNAVWATNLLTPSNKIWMRNGPEQVRALELPPIAPELERALEPIGALELARPLQALADPEDRALVVRALVGLLEALGDEARAETVRS